MTGVELLLFGFGLGVRHALDADHVVVVSTLLSHEPGVWRAVRVAVLWGTGHTLTFLSLGLLVVLSGVRVSPEFERLTELLVAVLLIALGSWHLLCLLRRERKPNAVRPLASARPVAVGLLHGLAGSAGVAVLATANAPSQLVAAGYLCLVALGTVLGMLVLTFALSRPLTWALKKRGKVESHITIVAGGLAVGLGLWVLCDILLSSPGA